MMIMTIKPYNVYNHDIKCALGPTVNNAIDSTTMAITL